MEQSSSPSESLSATVASPAPLPFRGDIEGLRGIAVLAVLLYHFRYEFAAGGFVGVDIFFVISGFLITSILIRRHQRGTFNYAQFMWTRVRRLLPALLVTVLFTFLAAGVFLAPVELKRLAQSSLAALASVSNIAYWLDAGYFDEASHTKPLLHTWSLGVEWQFYIVWPLLLPILLTVPRAWTIVLLIGSGIASVIASELVFPLDAAAPFYLLPFRIAEFFAGAFLCFLPHAKPSRLAPLFWLAGLSVIILSIALIRPGQPFPGLISLPVTIGTASVIAFGPATRISWLVDNQLMRALGRISYSVYLVHWPIYIFAFGLHATTPDQIQRIILFAASLTLGALLYAAVERPLRANTQAWPGPFHNRQFAVLTALVLIPTVIMVSTSLRNGWSWRWQANPALLAFAEELEREQKLYYAKYNLNFPNRAVRNYDPVKHADWACSLSDPTGAALAYQCLEAQTTTPAILLVGDSHGRDVLHALRQAYPNNRIVMLHQAACLPSTYPLSSTTTCFPDLIRTLRRLIGEGRVTGLVFSSRFALEKIAFFEQSLRELSRIPSPKLIIGPGPWLQIGPHRAIVERSSIFATANFNAVLAAQMRPSVFEASKRIEARAREFAMPFARKLDAFCTGAECRFVSRSGHSPLFWDDQHLTRIGMSELANWLRTNATVQQFMSAEPH